MPTDKRVTGRSSLVDSLSIPSSQELPKCDPEGDQRQSNVKPQVIGVLGKDGQIVKELEVLSEGEN